MALAGLTKDSLTGADRFLGSATSAIPESADVKARSRAAVAGLLA